MSSWLKKPIVGFAALVIALSAVGVYLAIRSDESVVASWSSRPESPVEDAVTTFDASASTGDVPIRCLWQFENETGTILHTLPIDGVATATVCRTTFTFANPRVKHVRLVAFDAEDDTDNDLKTFTSRPRRPRRRPRRRAARSQSASSSTAGSRATARILGTCRSAIPTPTSPRCTIRRAGSCAPVSPARAIRASVDSSWRAELMDPSTTRAGNILEGETWYYSFGVRFPAGFPTLENSHCSAAQWFGGGRQELGSHVAAPTTPRLTLRCWRSAPRPRAAGPPRFRRGRAGTCS